MEVIFGKRIGMTLGIMGHLFDNIDVPDWYGIFYTFNQLLSLKTQK